MPSHAEAMPHEGTLSKMGILLKCKRLLHLKEDENLRHDMPEVL